MCPFCSITLATPKVADAIGEEIALNMAVIAGVVETIYARIRAMTGKDRPKICEARLILLLYLATISCRC